MSFDPARVGVMAMVEAVRDAGYEVPHETLELAIVGMTCASCAGRVENALRCAACPACCRSHHWLRRWIAPATAPSR
ncbi:MAG: hypothetical protein ACYCUX_10985 [Metallibacterium sp.]